MSYNVRIFAYTGIVQLPTVNSKQQSADSVYVMVEPYEWSETLVVNGATPVASTAHATDHATLLRIEVPDGEAVRYEINPPNRSGGAVSAGTNSPSLSGKDQFFWGRSFTVSLVDAASFP